MDLSRKLFYMYIKIALIMVCGASRASWYNQTVEKHVEIRILGRYFRTLFSALLLIGSEIALSRWSFWWF